MRRLIQVIAWLLVISGGLIVVYFAHVAWVSGYRPWEDELDMPATGEFGDFVGGFVGTIISAAGFLFLYLTLKEQRESFAKERFENDFFELLKFHRENAKDSKLKKWVKSYGFENFEGREVFKIIFQEFLECLNEVRRFSKSKNINDYVTPKYLARLKDMTNRINSSIDLIELVTVDLAYSIVFFGADKEGEMVLRHRFIKRYNEAYFYKLIKYIQLKPKAEIDFPFQRWLQFQSKNIKERTLILNEIYLFRNHVKKNTELDETTRELFSNLDLENYYCGHQDILGHYFRHLFQSYKYLSSQHNLSRTEKYFYGKTLRAQLSTYEQALLFINSISSLGMKWELNPEIIPSEKGGGYVEENHLITFFNLIKNLPGEHLFGIRYKSYYPKVKYENDEQ